MRSLSISWTAVAVLAGCSSSSTASGAVRGEAAPQVVGPNAAAAALLECARLTYASTDQPLTARLRMDEAGQPVGLDVAGPGGEPAVLLCPSDRPNTDVVLGGGRGGSWGSAGTAAAWLAVAWCQRALDGSSGACSSSLDWIHRAQAHPAPSPAPASAAAPVAATVARAAEPRRYAMRRLGSDVREGASPARGTGMLLRLDAALMLCLHARQPDLSTSATTDLLLHARLNERDLGAAPMTPTGGSPAGLAESLTPCLRSALGATTTAPGPLLEVRYAISSMATPDPPGRSVQRVEVDLVQDGVETSVPTDMRRRFALELAQRVQRCVARHPVELLVSPAGWHTLPLRLEGSVDATRRDAVHLQSLSASQPPALLQRQAQCVVSEAPVAPGGTAARAQWNFAVRVTGAGLAAESAP